MPCSMLTRVYWKNEADRPAVLRHPADRGLKGETLTVHVWRLPQPPKENMRIIRSITQ